ncbi:hypothetical protein C1645_838527 [Glomus cerebriforme]|uniref:Uncharacterized protein n=1 Tax=Glomus cerebriforme TaxID=658196 RepID=A0A397SDS9_9GLOM|nr:hypothetical protein C1645_838527 [Glomus cerebriforme]
MSSYKTDNMSGLPVLYLQNHKQALWNISNIKELINTNITSLILQKRLLEAIESQLNSDEALIIVDYKMHINPKKIREIKDEWFGKCGWTLHSILLYTKSQDNNNINITAFDYWSGDTKQDAWFTASSLYKDLEYALTLLAIQEIDNTFDNDEELTDNDGLIKEILLVLSSSHYLIPRIHVSKSQH